MIHTIVRSDSAQVATLTLNRPQKLNALNGAMFIELDAHLTALETDTTEVGLVILRGAGTSFSAGLDLEDLKSGASAITPQFQARIIERLSKLPQPVIAAVHGYCYTGALELALAADLIFAAESAQFGDTHAKWGLTPAWGMTQRLPRRVGRAKALLMMYTASAVDAREAVEIGLADYCAPDDRFEDELASLASRIVANSWFSHRANKNLIEVTEGLSLSAGLAQEFYSRAGRAPDFEQRVARFTKR
jgi:enoyl-CoA hydratase